eukprot:3494313-Prymnesium_polylepis.1
MPSLATTPNRTACRIPTRRTRRCARSWSEGSRGDERAGGGYGMPSVMLAARRVPWHGVACGLHVDDTSHMLSQSPGGRSAAHAVWRYANTLTHPPPPATGSGTLRPIV